MNRIAPIWLVVFGFVVFGLLAWLVILNWQWEQAVADGAQLQPIADDQKLLQQLIGLIWSAANAMLILWVFLNWQRRRRRSRRNCCWSCGYNLSASEALKASHLFIRCPECGQKSMTKDSRQVRRVRR